jgi:hypothetical protein
MTPISPLSPELLASLRKDAKDGWNIALALLHLIDCADKRDQDVAKFVDSYSKTIAALCRRLEALELVARLRHPVEDAEATESGSVADAAQRITDYAAKAGMTVQDWAKAFNAAQVDDSPVANALLVAESALKEVAQWLHAHALDCHELGRNDWAEQLTRTATLLQQQEAELALLRQQPRPTFQDAIRLAQGCHDYSGGHTGPEGEAWHGAIDTVVGVLQRAAVGPWDSQTRAVFGVGVEAGEVAVPEPVAELDDQRRGAVHQAVAEALGSGAYDCLRVWEAWGVGTMGPDDFVPVAEDSDRVAEIADAAIEAIRAIPLPAPQAGEVEA